MEMADRLDLPCGNFAMSSDALAIYDDLIFLSGGCTDCKRIPANAFHITTPLRETLKYRFEILGTFWYDIANRIRYDSYG